MEAAQWIIISCLNLLCGKHCTISKQSPLHKPCCRVVRVIITVAYSRHDKSRNSMRGQGDGFVSSAQLPNDWYIGIGHFNRVKCLKPTINEPEVKLIEVKGGGVGLSSTPQWLICRNMICFQSQVCQTNYYEREVKSTEVRGVGWGSASLPNDLYMYVGTWCYFFFLFVISLFLA